jgi:hypothetical protein
MAVRAWQQALGGMGRAQETTAWQLRSRCWRGVTAARALAGLVAASRQEDRLGVAQLTEPSIGAQQPFLACLPELHACLCTRF